MIYRNTFIKINYPPISLVCKHCSQGLQSCHCRRILLLSYHIGRFLSSCSCRIVCCSRRLHVFSVNRTYKHILGTTLPAPHTSRFQYYYSYLGTPKQNNPLKYNPDHIHKHRYYIFHVQSKKYMYFDTSAKNHMYKSNPDTVLPSICISKKRFSKCIYRKDIFLL